MHVKINSKKYQKIDYAQLSELVDSISTSAEYDIVLEIDSLNWLQIFKEDGFVSIAQSVNQKKYHYNKLQDESKIKENIKEYFLDGKFTITQKPDEVSVIDNKKDFTWLGDILNIISLVLIFVFLKNDKYLDFFVLTFSLGLVISSYKSVIEKKYDARNDIKFFCGIFVFIVTVLRLII